MTLALLLLSMLAATAPPQPAQALRDGADLHHEISAPGEQTYSLDLQPGQLIEITLEENLVDLGLALKAPDGTTVALSDRHDTWVETVDYVAPTQATYTVTIKTVPLTLKGSYRLRYKVSEHVSERDRLRIEAQSLSQQVWDSLKVWSGEHSQEALPRIEKARDIWRKLDDREELAYSLLYETKANRFLGQHKRSELLAGQAFTSFVALGNREGAASALLLKGVAEGLMGQRDAAGEAFRQAIELSRQNHNDANLAYAYADLGGDLLGSQRDDEIERVLNEAIRLSHKVNHRMGEATALGNLAQYESNMGRYDQAEQHGQQAIDIFEALNSKGSLGVALIITGEAHELMGELQEALDMYQKSLVIRRELKDVEGIAFSLQYIGHVFIDQGRYEDALSKLKEAETELQKTDDRVNMADLLCARATALRLTGQYDGALQTLQHALKMSRDSNFPAGQAISLSDIAYLFYEIHDDERAIEYGERALALFQDTSNNEKFVALDTLAKLYLREGKQVESARWWKQLLDLAQKAKSKAKEADALIGLGQIYKQQGQQQLAEKTLQEALIAGAAAQNTDSRATALEQLSDLYMTTGRLQQSRQSLAEALAMFRNSRNDPELAKGLAQSARLELRTGNPDLAEQQILESLKISESLRAQIYNPSSRLTWFASAQEASKVQLEILMTLNQRRPGQGFDVAAFEATDRMRARSLRDSLKLNASSAAPPTENWQRQGQEQQIAEQLDALESQRTKLLFSGHAKQASQLEPQITDLQTHFEALEGTARRNGANQEAASHGGALTLSQIQSALDPSTILLEYSLGESKSYLFVVSRNSFHTVSLANEQTIRASVNRVNRLVTTGTYSEGHPKTEASRLTTVDHEFLVAARKLSQQLLDPVLPALGEKALAIVGDGVLNYLSFSLLPVSSALEREGSTYHPLILNHQITMIPSASLIIERQANMGVRAEPSKTVAIFADPVFNTQDARFQKDSNGVLAENRLNLDDGSRLLEHFEESKSPGASQLRTLRLKYTLNEARQIAAVSPSQSTLQDLGFDATVSNAMSPELSEYRYLHFATHGWLDPEHPEKSALVLSMIDIQQKPVDGLLTTRKVQQMRLRADLVTLSACQTGLGRAIAGEGLVGLTQAFLNAGATRVAVSYWNVNDQATADLMGEFYRGMLQRGLSPAAALRASQIHMLLGQKWKAPYYWAAFSVYGDW